jgi:hypothetical protein
VEYILERLPRRKAFILADDMGNGKALIAILVADAFGGETGRVLFVVPFAVKVKWLAELRAYFPHRDVRVLDERGTARTVCITNFLTGTHCLVLTYGRAAGTWIGVCLCLVSDGSWPPGAQLVQNLLQTLKLRRLEA